MTSHRFQKGLALSVFFALFTVACHAGPETRTDAVQPTQPAAPAQGQMQSPAGTAEAEINGKKIKIEYSRPSMRGRKIMGDLVPYDQVWRTGANKATHLTTEADLMFGSVKVPKGTYTIFTLPSAKGWKLIISKQTGQWGTNYTEGQDLARIDLEVKELSAPVEQFTILIDKADSGGVLKLEWEKTSASARFKAM